MNIAKLVDKYLKMMTSSVTFNFLKSYYKDIKNICKKNQEDFKYDRLFSQVYVKLF